MALIKIANIVWDDDGEYRGKRTTKTEIRISNADIEQMSEEELEERIGDALSNEYGWAVDSFSYIVIRPGSHRIR